MTANYHTHSNFCDHAKGDPEEYVKAAIAAGITELGFSEHAPCLFTDGHESHYRLPIARLAEYVKEISALRQKYAEKITIHLGFEQEYYPKYFEANMKLLKEAGAEYVILGQHFLNNEEGPHSIEPHEDEEHIKTYTQEVCEGIKTGAFSCLCHPDMVNFTGDERVYKKYAGIICETAKECDMPIEFNLLGFSTNRCYPNKKFFSVAAEVGNKVILGVDAHSPERFFETDVVERAKKSLAELGITPIERLDLKNPFAK